LNHKAGRGFAQTSWSPAGDHSKDFNWLVPKRQTDWHCLLQFFDCTIDPLII